MTADPVAQFLKILAATRTYFNAGKQLLAAEPPDLFAIYFQGIDAVCHLFAPYTGPVRPGTDAGAIEKYGGAVEAFYIFQDELIGDLLSCLPPGTAVIVVSDHGFFFGAEGPDRPAGVAGGGASWHRRGGVFIASGTDFVRHEIGDIEALEITPALLHLAGMPVPEDMPAGFPQRLFRKDGPASAPPVYIASYEDGAESAAGGPVPGKYDTLVVEELEALGYLSPETVNYHLNRGEISLRAGDLGAAERAFRKALSMRPGLRGPSVRVARVLLARGACDEALEILDAVSPQDREEKSVLIIRMKALASCGRDAEAREILTALRGRFPGDPDIEQLSLRP